jgi:hypothetical protein
LAASEIEDEIIYKEAFENGKNYSVKFGKLIGEIEYVNYIVIICIFYI